MATGRDRDRDSGSSRGSGGSGKSQKTKMRASINPTDVEQYGLADHFDFTILDAWYGPWQMVAKDGTTYDPILALWVEYERSDEDKPHVEPVGMGSSALKYFVPSETGYEEDYAGNLSREEWLEIANGNIGNNDLGELRGGHLLPISTRVKLPENTNGDFWFRTLKSSAEANGVELVWTDDQGLRDIGDVLKGLQGHASRMKNDLQKDMDFGDSPADAKKKDRKVLCIVEVSGYEKVASKKPAGGSRKPKDEDEEDDRSSRRSTSRRGRDEDEEPEKDTRHSARERRGRAEEDEDEPQGRGRAGSRGRSRGREEEPEEDEDDRKTASRDRGGRSSGRSSGKKPAGPDLSAIAKDRDFIGAYFDEVIPKVESTKGKKVQRMELVEISDFDDQEWNEVAFELATSDDKWVTEWWARRREVDYDEEDGMVRLAK